MKPGDTHYDVLGVTPGAAPVEVRRAYLALARRYHPDFHVHESVEAQEEVHRIMRAVNAAWAELGSADRRAAYDRRLRNAGLLAPGAPSPGRSAPHVAATTAPEPSSGSTLPQWLTMAPVACMAVAVFCFAVGFVTGLPALLAGAIGFGLLGGFLFVLVPVVALKRASDDGEPDGPTVSA